jgi:pyruvate,water dikinase
MAFVMQLGEDDSDVHDLVGGKGANLSRLIQAGYPVPPAFCVTTDAYSRFLAGANLEDKIATLMTGLDVTDPLQFEAVAEEIAGLILASSIPAEIAEAITTAYAAFPGCPHVAVRSSGTAEDLAEASFAGLHDTFLDVTGTAEVVEAVRRCWASLWNPRAAVYRHNNGFDQLAARLAVVVQVMVDAEVAGVMFTGNPLTMATDETLINANFGLGESVVGGIATPDQFVVKNTTLAVVERTLGAKEVRVVRHPCGVGTTEEDLPEHDRARYSMTDRQVSELTELGRRVQNHYDGFPQDTEWALAGGRFFLLQSRPVTGVEFSWDAELDDGLWGQIPEDPETVWTRAFADELTTGAVSPLTYAVRYPPYSRGAFGVMMDFCGSDYSSTRRMFRYYKGEVYCDTRWARVYAERLVWPEMRPLILAWTAPGEREEILNAPFSWPRYVTMMVKNIARDSSKRPYAALKQFDRHWRSEAQTRKTRGKTSAELRAVPDTELLQYIADQHAVEDEFGRYITFPCVVWLSGMMTALELMLKHWYDGQNENAFVEVISGGTQQTDTQKENLMLWRLSERIRNSGELRRIFDAHPDAAFFTALEDSAEGRAFLAEYRETIGRFSHRGHSDRDMIYPRRGEDPGLDYRSFKMLLGGASVDPERLEREANTRREAALADVVANFRHKRFGRARARAFARAHDLLHRLMAFRDDERQNPTDLATMSYKRGFVELGRRLHERGLLAAAEDVHYLSTTEAYDLFEGRAVNRKLLAAKIVARRRDVERMVEGESDLPMYLYRNRPMDAEPLPEGDGHWVGQPMSSGTVTGTARIVGRLADVDRVKQGEILVVHATDPGWTPVFLVLGGIVVQAGGPLAHAACLSREYGLPAVQLPGAMKLIPDGATISVNGTTGTVTLVEDSSLPAEDLLPAAAAG